MTKSKISVEADKALIDMVDEVRAQISRMRTAGVTPGAVVVDPPLLARLLDVMHRRGVVYTDDRGRGSGWAIHGLPIWRSWDLAGVTVISQGVLDAFNARERVDVHGAPLPVLF